MSTWVMVILLVQYRTSAPSSAVTVTGFHTRESCVSSVEFVKRRESTADVYCVEVK